MYNKSLTLKDHNFQFNWNVELAWAILCK